MRNFVGIYAARWLAGLAVAAAAALPLYLTATPSRSLERIAREISGPAVVIDGDTLAIGGARIRLEGIDAPELAQRCDRRTEGGWRAGDQAAVALRAMVRGRTVSCYSSGKGKYGRVLATCHADGRDLNRAMVRIGMAWAFVRYSHRFVSEERAAERAGVGVWRHRCQPAWVYRDQRWSAHASGAPRGCAIKGNISRGRRIYHMPWTYWYRRTRIDPDKGERWFCNEDEAMAAGWVPSRS